MTSTHAVDLEEITGFIHRWADAIVANDVARMALFVTEDWVLVGQTGSICRDSFHELVASGILQHHTMTHEVLEVRQLGLDVAFLRTRGRNTGTYQGNPIEADEWTTDILVRTSDGWRCALTHLTPVALT
jgi:uncharacterized protein (TIGR02246 family)